MMIYTYIHLLVFIAQFTLIIQAQEYFSNSDDYAETDSELVSVEHSIHRKLRPEIAINIKIRGIESKYILQPSYGFFAGKDTKIWVANKNGDKLKYTLQRNIMEKVNTTFYLDEKTKSAIAHTVNEDGTSEFNGVIGSNKILRSLNNHDRKRRDVASKLAYESANDGSKNYHLLYKRDASSRNQNNYHQTSETNKNYQQNTKDSSKIPKIVYPEILIFVDKTIFEYYKKDIVKTTGYVLTMFNGVDLYFRDMYEPSILLSIAGIVLCEDEINTETLNGSTLNGAVLDNFGIFLLGENKFQLGIDYDAAVYLLNPTKKSIYKGISYARTTCQYNNDMILSASLVQDTGSLDGIKTAAHELGHLFGSDHDEFPEKVCCFKKGFIMSYNLYDQNQFFFSPCSKESIKWHLSREAVKCVRNNPADRRTDSQILRVLPGQYMSLDEQCKKSGYSGASTVNEDICLRANCMKGKVHFSLDGAVLEGTPCDIGKFCLKGECVDVPFNNSDKNADINSLFPLKHHLSKTESKTAEQQCVKFDYEVAVKAFIDVCKLNCVIKTNAAFYVKQYIVDDETPCYNNGTCKNGRCIDDKYLFAHDYCKRAGTDGFSNYSTKECIFNCKIITYNVSDNFYNFFHDQIITIKELLAPNGYPCYNNGFCQEGNCIKLTFSTATTTTTTTSTIEPSTFVDERFGEFVSSIKHCKQHGIKWRWVLDLKDRCSIRCKNDENGEYEYFNASRGFPCPNNGFCEGGKCVNQDLTSTTTALNNLHSSKFQSIFVRCQELGFFWDFDYNDGCKTICTVRDYGEIRKFDREYLIAENGVPCNNSGYCHDGICVNMTDTTSSTTSRSTTSSSTTSRSTTSISTTSISTSSRSTTSSSTASISNTSRSTTSSSNTNTGTTPFVIETPTKLKTPSEQCEEMGWTFLETFNSGCMTSCYDRIGNEHYLSAPEGYPCNIDSKTDGYCSLEVCLEQSFTSTVSIIGSTTSLNKLPINEESPPLEQCMAAGFAFFHSYDKFDCSIVCTNVTDLEYEYEYEEDYEHAEDETNIYQDLFRPDGIPCKYHGHCLNGECVNMSLINPDDKSTKWNFDALEIFQNNTRRVIIQKADENYSKLFKNGENEKKHKDSIDFSDIDDDVKEFAQDIEIFV